MLDAVMDLFTSDPQRAERIAELKQLEDHELADLGLARDQIEAFVDAAMQ